MKKVNYTVKFVLTKSSGFANPEGAVPWPLVVDWQIHDIMVMFLLVRIYFTVHYDSLKIFLLLLHRCAIIC
ncbi:hypothetical protein H8E77_03665 [bacterium]|nr:hypothetical protein [bacterium]